MNALNALCLCLGIAVVGILVYKALDDDRTIKITTTYGTMEIS